MIRIPADLRSSVTPESSLTEGTWRTLKDSIKEFGVKDYGFAEAVESHQNFSKGEDDSETRARFLAMIFDVYSKLHTFVEKKAYSLEQKKVALSLFCLYISQVVTGKSSLKQIARGVSAKLVDYCVNKPP